MSALIVLNAQNNVSTNKEIVAGVNALFQQQWNYVVYVSSSDAPFHADLQEPAVTAAEIALYEEECATEPYVPTVDDFTCGGGPVTATMMACSQKKLSIYKGPSKSTSAFSGMGVEGAPLEAALKARGITAVTVCGFTDVMETASDASMAGFKTTISKAGGPDKEFSVADKQELWVRSITVV